MKKIIALITGIAMLSTGCAEFIPTVENPPTAEQENITSQAENEYTPLNYENQKGQWFPYVDFPKYMEGKTEEKYKEELTQRLSKASQEGINTVYFHVHPQGDAYYKSEIYPKGKFNDMEYDPFGVFLEIAHSMEISVHGWLNPYRLQTAEDMEQLPDSFIVKQWINNGSPMVRLVGNRWYLNPAYPPVTELIADTVRELMENYNLDGIHIDDYFYPDTAEDFDREAFENSSADDLSQWRRENITNMVKAVYDTVKGRDERILFGISPQGNINADYDTQFADVELWTRNKGYADYIVPQIYYGFENEVCPFEATLRQWEDFAENGNVSLIIGLAEYKENKYDKWAGVSGETEWLENDDIIKRQIDMVNASGIADGYALYK